MELKAQKPTVFYHIAGMNHWREIVSEQTRLLAASGFDGEVQISFLGGEYEDGYVRRVMERHGLEHTFVFRSGNLKEYEFPALRAMFNACAAGLEGPVIYFHTKGASKPGDWATLMWRWLMNAYVISHWRDLHASLVDGKNVAGTAWMDSMFPCGAFAGTFYVTDAAYVRTMTPPDSYVAEFQECLRHSNPHGWDVRHAAEFWINSRLTAIPANHGPRATRLWDHAWWVENTDIQDFATLHGS